MKKKGQIILIRGGVAKENFKDYYDFLEQQEYNPYEEKYPPIWSELLAEKVTDYEVLEMPRPNKGFADYKAWKIMFEKMIPYFQKNNILIGHSLGGSFLLKYFLEDDKQNIFKNAEKIILVAPATEDSPNEKLGNFNFLDNNNFEKINSNKITIFYSQDDEIVPPEQVEKLKNLLNKAKFVKFKDKGHFLIQDFKELEKEALI